MLEKEAAENEATTADEPMPTRAAATAGAARPPIHIHVYMYVQYS